MDSTREHLGNVENCTFYNLIMYNFCMSQYSVTQAREKFADIINESAVEEVFLEKHGKTVAVVISAEVYEKLHEAWEDLEDLKIFEEAEADEQPGIPMEQVFHELGIA